MQHITQNSQILDKLMPAHQQMASYWPIFFCPNNPDLGENPCQPSNKVKLRTSREQIVKKL